MDGIVTLEKSIGLLREENSQGWNTLIDKTERGTESTESLNKTVGDLLKEIRGSRLDKLEEKREEKSKPDVKPDVKIEGKDDEGGLPSMSDLGIVGAIAAIGASFAGLVRGLITGVLDNFRFLDEFFLKGVIQNRIVNPVIRFFDAIGDIIRKSGTGQILKGDTFKVFGRFTVTLRNIAERVKKILKPLRSGFNRFLRFFTRIGDFFRGVGGSARSFILGSKVIQSQLDSLSELKTVFQGVGDTAKEGSGIISKLGKIVRPFFDVFRRLGRFLGGPITVAIFSIVDGFIGAFKGFTETEGGLFAKITGALSGAYAGVVSGFVGGILDLGKMLVGFVAGLFGADDFKEKLKSFSFQEIIFDAFMFPFRAIMSFFDGEEGNIFSSIIPRIKEGIVNIVTNVKDTIMNMFTNEGEDGGALTIIRDGILKLITLPADLLRKAVAWVGGKLGFDGVENLLNNFSFFEIYKSISDGVVGLLTKSKDFVVSKFNNLVSFFQNPPSIGELFNSIKNKFIELITMPYDLLVDGVAFIAEKLGFDQFSETLEGFSVKDTVQGLVDWFIDLPSRLVDGLLGLFEDFSISEVFESVGNITDSVKKSLKGILRATLPDPTASVFTAEGAAARLIPDSVYEFAGINRETGERIPQQQVAEGNITEEPQPRPRPERPEFTQRQMARAQLEVSEKENKQAEQKAMVNAVDASQRVVNNNNNVNNNQTALINSNMPAVDNLDRIWSW